MWVLLGLITMAVIVSIDYRVFRDLAPVFYLGTFGLLVLVLALSAIHGLLARWVRDFATDRNRKSQRFYRIINEIPAVLMVGIVILAVVKPF